MTTFETQTIDRGSAVDDGSRPLRLALKLDAVASGAIGVLSLAAGPVLEDRLGAPLAVLWPVGVALVAWAAALWIVATRAEVSGTAARSVVALNLLWVVASVVAVAGDWMSLTALGTAFVLLQAAAVVIFAGLQFLGLRRLQPAV